MSQAPGLSGTPEAGHFSSAATSASCASSSARPTSRVMRASAATIFADSIRQTASIAACVAELTLAVRRSGPYQRLEPAPEHALAVERKLLRVHHVREALVL